MYSPHQYDPPSRDPSADNDAVIYRLRRSGIMLSLPNEYDERAVSANGEVLQPDYWVENSVADLNSGRDAAFEKALELLAANENRSLR